MGKANGFLGYVRIKADLLPPWSGDIRAHRSELLSIIHPLSKRHCCPDEPDQSASSVFHLFGYMMIDHHCKESEAAHGEAELPSNVLGTRAAWGTPVYGSYWSLELVLCKTIFVALNTFAARKYSAEAALCLLICSCVLVFEAFRQRPYWSDRANGFLVGTLLGVVWINAFCFAKIKSPSWNEDTALFYWGGIVFGFGMGVILASNPWWLYSHSTQNISKTKAGRRGTWKV